MSPLSAASNSNPAFCDPQRYLTLAAAPVSVVLLFLAYYSVRKENRLLMYAVLATCIGAAAYFLFKVFRIYQGKGDAYRLVYKTLTVFCKSGAKKRTCRYGSKGQKLKSVWLTPCYRHIDQLCCRSHYSSLHSCLLFVHYGTSVWD